MAQNAVFVMLMASAERFQVYCGQFFLPILMYFFALLVTQVPRLPKQVIFVRTMTTMTTTDIRTDCFTPCACAWGNNHFAIIMLALTPAAPPHPAPHPH